MDLREAVSKAERAKTYTTSMLLDALYEIEKHLEDEGLSPSRGWVEGSTQKAGELHDLCDARERLKEELGKRFIGHELKDLREHVERLEENQDGIQYAVDQLKKHEHSERTGEPLRPFR